VHTEEIADRVEPLLATPLRRHTYLASNTVFALVGTAAALLLAGIALGLVASAQEGSVSTVRVIAQALATVPAVWTLVLLALAAVGAKPLLRLIGWLGVVATFALTLLGPTFNLADWMLDISPLRHVPNVAASTPDWTGLVWLALFAVLFLAIAFGGYRRRDIL
jgi:ABC-2 type transport system permease protein